MSTHGFLVYDGTDIHAACARQMLDALRTSEGRVILRGAGWAQPLIDMSPEGIFVGVEMALRQARDKAAADDGEYLGRATIYCDEAPTVTVNIRKGHPVCVSAKEA
jgi:hypothetical protein